MTFVCFYNNAQEIAYRLFMECDVTNIVRFMLAWDFCIKKLGLGDMKNSIRMVFWKGILNIIRDENKIYTHLKSKKSIPFQIQ